MSSSDEDATACYMNVDVNFDNYLVPECHPMKLENIHYNKILLMYREWSLSKNLKLLTISMLSSLKQRPLYVEKEIKEDITSMTIRPAPRKYEIIKTNLLTFGYGHIAAAYGLYLAFTEARWQTLVLAYITFVFAGLGMTAGAHRLWSHKSYKAKLPLEIILIVLNSFSFQNSAINWVRDHRLHHKYSDTDADPHNASRGFFFSHIGWLLVRKHPEVREKGKNIDMTDIYSNPVLRFQKKYAIPFIGSICFVLPTVVPIYFWGESSNVAWHLTVCRYIMSLHATYLINSAAHKWGSKPYDKSILPSQSSIVAFITGGEGFHNYHHVFPWDYKAAELGAKWLNITTPFIDFFAKIGWAYDLRSASEDVIVTRAKKTGDGSFIRSDD